METLAFNTVIMGNSVTAVLATIVGYLVLTWLVSGLTRVVTSQTAVTLPARLFAPERHAGLRDAWTDIAIGMFSMASILVYTGSSPWAAILALFGAVLALVLRTLGDSVAACPGIHLLRSGVRQD